MKRCRSRFLADAEGSGKSGGKRNDLRGAWGRGDRGWRGRRNGEREYRKQSDGE